MEGRAPGDRDSLAGAPLSTEPGAGLRVTTVRSQLEPKPRPQAPTPALMEALVTHW